MSAPPLVSLKHVSKRFSGGVLALGDFSLEVREGEFLSLLGPSGCGKSTALRIVAGLTGATSGDVSWSLPEAEREIGFVFQEPTLMPWATVEKNIFLPLRLKGASWAEARPRVEEAIALVGLEGFSSAFPRALSGGMKMRVSIARALVTRPRLLLMDEPFAALDEITRFRLNDDLSDLWRRLGFTVVFVTHSVFESVFLSTRLAVMTARPGRIAQVLDNPAGFPRGEAYRMSAEFNALCARASAALHAAMGEAGAAA